jgi:hypothetical protein
VSPAKRQGGGTRKSGGKAVTSSSSGKAAKRPCRAGAAREGRVGADRRSAPRRAAATPRRAAKRPRRLRPPSDRRGGARPPYQRPSGPRRWRPWSGGAARAGSRVFDVLNMNRETVGQVDLSSGLFATRPNAALIHEAVVMRRRRSVRAVPTPRGAPRSAAAGASRGSRRAPGARARGRSARRCGGGAGPCSDRRRGATGTHFPGRRRGPRSRAP